MIQERVAVVQERVAIVQERVAAIQARFSTNFKCKRLDLRPPGLRDNTLGAARIRERLPGDGNELPVVAGWMQREFQHTMRIIVSDLTVWGNSSGRRGKARATRAHHELTNAASWIRCSIWVLLGEALIHVTVTVQNDICASLVEQHPEILHA